MRDGRPLPWHALRNAARVGQAMIAHDQQHTPLPPRHGRARTYRLEDTGFRDVPASKARFCRHWGGAGDSLAPNEALCSVCLAVVRSTHELEAGKHVVCVACDSRLVLARGEDGLLVARP
jgi:hypothetical protein